MFGDLGCHHNKHTHTDAHTHTHIRTHKDTHTQISLQNEPSVLFYGSEFQLLREGRCGVANLNQHTPFRPSLSLCRPPLHQTGADRGRNKEELSPSPLQLLLLPSGSHRLGLCV